MSISALRRETLEGRLSARAIAEEVLGRLESSSADPATWIHRLSRDEILSRAESLDVLPDGVARLPLFGIPFAVKDNIDVAGIPTTAACPSFAHIPTEDAHAVRRLLDAGAILIGKTNLDQFATGLVGTRSPHGAPRCVFNPDYISGGSSSGSAVAVASGQVAFSLGTDTAGSGRVPAAFNDIVGVKPTRGRVSTRGVLPACRSLDCVTVFANTVSDARLVLSVMEDFDPDDPFSRRLEPVVRSTAGIGTGDPGLDAFQFGIPAGDQLKFFGDGEAQRLFAAAVERLTAMGGVPVEIDFAPFAAAAVLLYDGPWLAERDVAVGDFIRARPTAVHPVVRSIILAGSRYSAADAFRGSYALAELRRRTDAVLLSVDLLVLPTSGTIYRYDEVMAEPYALNANLGYYTNFMNLLDLCGVAVPAGFRGNATPFGITLVGEAGGEDALFALACEYEARYRAEVQRPSAVSGSTPATPIRVAVVGAHLSGQPLNHQLTGRDARLVRACRTASTYRLYALAGTTPPKPGLIHVGPEANGAALEVEVWEMGAEAFGTFVELVPPPLAIGSVQLEDGSWVKGFVCEPRGIEGAEDITAYGGWRGYMGR